MRLPDKFTPSTEPSSIGYKKGLFRHFSGLGRKVQTATVEQDCDPKVILVTETAGGVLNPLDLGVDGFAGRVGHAMAEVGDDVLETSL